MWNKGTILLGVLGVLFLTILFNYILPSFPITDKQNINQSMKEILTSNDDSEESSPSFQKESFSRIFHHTLRSFHTITAFRNQYIHIVAIGDSLTQGVGDQSEQGGYVGIVQQHLKQRGHIQAFGKRGLRTDQLIKRLEEQEIAAAIKQADIVILTIGANDVMQVVKNHFTELTYEKFVEEQLPYQERLRKIFERIRTLNGDAKIYLLGMFNPFEQYFGDIQELDRIVDDWNRIGRNTVQQFPPAVFIPTKDLFSNRDHNLFHSDHFHPNTKGYELIARRILYYLIHY
ncbi:lysophospholipase L1-like esterase [Melghiribacillus thermohalophilus]|uniref:Lysophospholipase L1-like esterase n=1 Tax=Melghiribacillus thermohalophilus TaxID=1324956 RepID=A0A4R3N9T8_9BACI|nr:SGNH/GDSL hydrolase family protein [Melghiribacillus thermohalophilus]TCT25046.1 lysophospholipase L1-like esterase [Melghiribacillus thermohalophilus]